LNLACMAVPLLGGRTGPFPFRLVNTSPPAFGFFLSLIGFLPPRFKTRVVRSKLRPFSRSSIFLLRPARSSLWHVCNFMQLSFSSSICSHFVMRFSPATHLIDSDRRNDLNGCGRVVVSPFGFGRTFRRSFHCLWAPPPVKAFFFTTLGPPELLSHVVFSAELTLISLFFLFPPGLPRKTWFPPPYHHVTYWDPPTPLGLSKILDFLPTDDPWISSSFPFKVSLCHVGAGLILCPVCESFGAVPIQDLRSP